MTPAGYTCALSIPLDSAPWERSEKKRMKGFWRVVAAVLILVGVVWFLQGVNILPGSFMTGQIQWAVYGGVTAAAGLALYLLSRRP